MPAEIATKTVVLKIPGMDAVTVRKAVEYAPGLSLDLYYPAAHHPENPKPAVVVILGYRDAGVPTPFGCQFREMGMTISWCQLFAASGMIGVAYETANPTADAASVIAHLRTHAAELGIDPTKLGIWSASGNVPVALSVLFQQHVQCAALCYGFMLDLDGATAIEQAATQFRFADPNTGWRVEDLPKDTAIFLARAGQEQFAGLNESIDAFAAAALRLNLPLTLVNHPSAPHAFDLIDDTEASRRVVQAILAFLTAHLL